MRGTGVFGALLLAMGWVVACGAEGGGPNGVAPSFGGSGGTDNDASVLPCSGDASRTCAITVGQQGSVLTCYEGTQHCQNGAWGPCTDGTTVTRSLPGGGMHWMSLSDAGACQANPCDPSCQVFNETPDGGLSLDASQSGPVWQVGNNGDLENTNWPGGQYAKGNKEPCYSGQDCQFDQYCKYPLTQASCAHSKCTTGAALSSTCEECVTKVCADTPSCCTTAWTAACIDKVGKICNSFCEKTGTCEHTKCQAGNKLANGCDPCVSSICALRPSCCTGTWDNYCLSMVGSVCNVNCGASDGDCVQYNPGEKNPNCTTLPDLTAGVPCGQTIPICNRGSVAVAANTAAFWVYPASSSHWQECSPDLTASGGWPKKCPIPNQIDPGQCVSVYCAELDQLKTVVVNPWSDPARIAECSCQNNWSLFKKETGNNPMTCAAPSCAASTVKASVATVNMFIAFDKSGSMCEPQESYGCSNPGATTRWGLTTGALKSFIRDAKSAGIRVALRFFPGNDAGTVCGGYCLGWGTSCYTATCGSNGCATPQVDLGPLLAPQLADPPPTNCASSGDPQECSLVKVINANYPNGGTPISEALNGAVSRMSTYVNTNPLERAVVVLVTDGEPTWCETNQTTLANIAGNAYKNYGIITYTVGLASANQTLLTAIATQGHGQAFFLSSNNTSADLVTALNTIRNNSVSCDLTLDTTNGINVNDVTLNYTSSGTTYALGRVLASGNCGTQNDKWYFDNNSTPTKITLCPDTCARVRGDLGAQLSVKIGCPMVFQPQTFTQVYQGSCGPSQAVQWGFLTWSSAEPTNSYITFEGRTAADPAAFNTAPLPGELKQLGVAHGNVAPYTTDTQVCPLTGGPAGCPVDLYGKLGIPAANLSNLEVRATLYPSTTGSSQAPLLSSWNVTYSCIQAL